MRITWLLVFIFLWPKTALAETIDLHFQSSNNSEYRTTSLQADLKRHYGIESPGARVLLIETPYLSSPLYKVQNKHLNGLGHRAEEYGIIFVVACQNEVYSHGYHTTVEEALKLADHQSVF